MKKNLEKSNRRLALSKNTLRRLSENAMGQVLGNGPNTQNKCQTRITCYTCGC